MGNFWNNIFSTHSLSLKSVAFHLDTSDRNATPHSGQGVQLLPEVGAVPYLLKHISPRDYRMGVAHTPTHRKPSQEVRSGLLAGQSIYNPMPIVLLFVNCPVSHCGTSRLRWGVLLTKMLSCGWTRLVNWKQWNHYKNPLLNRIRHLVTHADHTKWCPGQCCKTFGCSHALITHLCNTFPSYCMALSNRCLLTILWLKKWHVNWMAYYVITMGPFHAGFFLQQSLYFPYPKVFSHIIVFKKVIKILQK
jgi:hypothetical protein